MFESFFKKREKNSRNPIKSLPKIAQSREAEFITIDRVKSALRNNDLSEIVELFELFLDRDLKIAEGIEKRQNAIIGLAPVIEAGKKEQKIIDKVFEQSNLSEWMYALSDGIYYGYSLLELDWKESDGLLIPASVVHHTPTLLRYDGEKEQHYIPAKDDKKLYLDSLSPRLVMYRHTKKGDNIQNRALAYKLLYYALLKHVAIGYNIQYFDSLSVPPLIIKSENMGDEDMNSLLSDALMALKSNSYGIFPSTVSVETLKVGTQADFLGLIEYFDGLIAQYLVGATSISDGSSGSLALAKMQEHRFQEKVLFDARRIEEGMSTLLNTILSLNLATFTPVKFTLPVTKESTAEEFASIVEKLGRGGYVVCDEQIEKKLGIKLKSTAKPEKNSAIHKEHNTTQAKAKPLSIQEQILQDEDLTPIHDELNWALQILESASSYEEALSQIESWDNPKMEEALRRLLLANDIIGTLE